MHKIKPTINNYQKSPHLASCLSPSKTIRTKNFNLSLFMWNVLLFKCFLNSSKSPTTSEIRNSTIQYSNNKMQVMTGYSYLTHFSPLFPSKMTYYSQSKVVIHLSNKSTLQLISQKVFKRLSCGLATKKFCWFFLEHKTYKQFRKLWIQLELNLENQFGYEFFNPFYSELIYSCCII